MWPPNDRQRAGAGEVGGNGCGGLVTADPRSGLKACGNRLELFASDGQPPPMHALHADLEGDSWINRTAIETLPAR